MSSTNRSKTATVVTVSRYSTEAVPSLTVSVEGDVSATRVALGATRARRAARVPSAATMTSEDIAEMAIFVHQLIQIGASTRADAQSAPGGAVKISGEPSSARTHLTATGRSQSPRTRFGS